LLELLGGEGVNTVRRQFADNTHTMKASAAFFVSFGRVELFGGRNLCLSCFCKLPLYPFSLSLAALYPAASHVGVEHT